MSFNDLVKQKALEIENKIKEYLPEENGYQKTVAEAMNYSILAGGKRLRPMLMSESFHMYKKACGESDVEDADILAPFMAAMEMIHTYSLVHDDLPAMDNDEYRRGRKTTHVVYGEAMAILAGDGLLTHAFETASKVFDNIVTPEDYKAAGRAMQILASKAGINGMLGGQCADVEAEKQAISIGEDRLLFIHENKTAAMIESSLMIGAVLGKAPQEDVEKLEKIGSLVGIAFQIKDDILDVESSLEVLGKPIGSDAKNEKSTYVSLNGIEKAKEDVLALTKQAEEIFNSLTQTNEFLFELLDSLITRQY